MLSTWWHIRNKYSWIMRSCYQADVTLPGFRSQLETSHVSSHTDELWYNIRVCGWPYIYIYIYIYIVPAHCPIGRVFANGPEDRSSIPGWIIPKTQKILLDTSFLNTHHYKVRIKVKLSNPGKVGVPPSTLRCCNWKGCLWVNLDYGHQIYLHLQN